MDEKNSAMEEMDLSYEDFFQKVLKEIFNAVETTRTQVCFNYRCFYREFYEITVVFGILKNIKVD